MRYFTKWETIVPGLYSTVTTDGREYHLLRALEKKGGQPLYTLLRRCKDDEGTYHLTDVDERNLTKRAAETMIESLGDQEEAKRRAETGNLSVWEDNRRKKKDG